jgi:Fic family protein
MNQIASLLSLNPSRFETVPILKRLSSANRKLGEFKGVAGTIPNQTILINTLGIQEAKNSSEIENIVTTQDELFQGLVTSESQTQGCSEYPVAYQ